MKPVPCPFCGELPLLVDGPFLVHLACENEKCVQRPIGRRQAGQEMAVRTWNWQAAHGTLNLRMQAKKKTDYLARLEKANPRLFAAKEIKMTPSAFIEQIQRAYQAGADHVPMGRGNLFDELFPPLHKKP